MNHAMVHAGKERSCPLVENTKQKPSLRWRLLHVEDVKQRRSTAVFPPALLFFEQSCRLQIGYRALNRGAG